LAAISLAKRLAKGWKLENGTFTVRDVYKNDWTGLGTPDQVRAALRLLEEYGWVRREKLKSESGGRPSEVYAVNPKIGGAHVDH
jgi:putative DNA primase/helicase